jgi:AraC-like DNA-binding protein
MYGIRLLASLGAVQGLLLLSLIVLRYRHHKNLPLALLLLVFSLRLGSIPAWNEAMLVAHPWLYPATAPLPFLFGPLLWWYARELAREEDATPRFASLHFVPYLLEVTAVVATVVSLSPAEYEAFVGSVFAGAPPLWVPVRNGLKVALNVVYIALTARIAFGPAIRGAPAARKAWVRALVIIPTASLVPFAVVAIDSRASARLAEGAGLPFLILAGTMAFLIYAFSMLVLLAPDLPARGAASKCRQTTPHLPETECRRLARRVTEILATGAFRDPELSIKDLAERLEVHPNRLSSAVNHVFGASFRRLVNRYRLEYFNTRLADGALEEENILELAFEAGFPSKSTFNRVFKERYGVPPSVYASNVLDKSSTTPVKDLEHTHV